MCEVPVTQAHKECSRCQSLPAFELNFISHNGQVLSLSLVFFRSGDKCILPGVYIHVNTDLRLQELTR